MQTIIHLQMSKGGRERLYSTIWAVLAAFCVQSVRGTKDHFSTSAVQIRDPPHPYSVPSEHRDIRAMKSSGPFSSPSREFRFGCFQRTESSPNQFRFQRLPPILLPLERTLEMQRTLSRKHCNSHVLLVRMT